MRPINRSSYLLIWAATQKHSWFALVLINQQETGHKATAISTGQSLRAKVRPTLEIKVGTQQGAAALCRKDNLHQEAVVQTATALSTRQSLTTKVRPVLESGPVLVSTRISEYP
jgi:hypothetical protein